MATVENKPEPQWGKFWQNSRPRPVLLVQWRQHLSVVLLHEGSLWWKQIMLTKLTFLHLSVSLSHLSLAKSHRNTKRNPLFGERRPLQIWQLSLICSRTTEVLHQHEYQCRVQRGRDPGETEDQRRKRRRRKRRENRSAVKTTAEETVTLTTVHYTACNRRATGGLICGGETNWTEMFSLWKPTERQLIVHDGSKQ